MHVISYDDNAPFKVSGPRSQKPRVQFEANATYLLVGCLGGLGRAVASWMASRGAMHLAFISRTGTIGNRAAAEAVEALEARGVKVLSLQGDIMHLDDVARAVTDIRSHVPAFPPIRGVLNAAGILHDGLFSNMTAPVWHKVAPPKVQGCLNLHHVFSPARGEEESNAGQPELDFFVMTSSVACTFGSAGQSNYAAANAFQDALARHRRSRGLPAVSLILPAISGIGYIAEHPELKKSIQSKGMYDIGEQEMLNAFEVAMMPQRKQDIVGDHIIVGAQPRRYGAAVQAASAHAPWVDDPRFGWLQSAVEDQAVSDGKGGGCSGKNSLRQRQDIVSVIRQAASRDLAITAVADHVAARLARLLLLDENKIHMTQRSVASHGLDSMIGAEFRNWIFRDFGADVPFQQLLAGSLTISELAGVLCDNVLSN